MSRSVIWHHSRIETFRETEQGTVALPKRIVIPASVTTKSVPRSLSISQQLHKLISDASLFQYKYPITQWQKSDTLEYKSHAIIVSEWGFRDVNGVIEDLDPLVRPGTLRAVLLYYEWDKKQPPNTSYLVKYYYTTVPNVP